MVELESSSPEETERIGAALARELAPGDLVTVAGELGAGKTTFVRGACRALGVAVPVTSPTYALGQQYRGDVTVSHLDLYRLEGMSEEDWGDLEAYLGDAVVFVEWPERADGFLPPAKARASLRHLGGGHRLVVLESAEKSLEMSLSTRARPRA